jgi:hypothetical protein
LTSLAETTIKTSSTGHPNFPNWPRYLQSLPHVRICFSPEFLNLCLKLRAKVVI